MSKKRKKPTPNDIAFGPDYDEKDPVMLDGDGTNEPLILMDEDGNDLGSNADLNATDDLARHNWERAKKGEPFDDDSD